jgi:hypothetical protein
MSLVDFQIALSKLIASPKLSMQALHDEQFFFDQYDLSDKEKNRLHVVLRQKGFSACCSLYRMNRITPLYTQLSNTSFLLGDELVPLVEEFWDFFTETSLQFKEEVLSFGHFLFKKIDEGKLNVSYLKDILKLELAMNELSYAPEGEVRILKFEYDIFEILKQTVEKKLGSDPIAHSNDVYQLYLSDHQLQMELI